MADGTERFRALMAQQAQPPCGELTPFTLLYADPDEGFVRVHLTAQPAFRNRFDVVQGGFAVAMLDLVLSLAAFCKTGRWLPTAEIKANFLAPLPIADCTGEGKVVKAGRRLAFVEARLILPSGAPAVTATATAVVPDK